MQVRILFESCLNFLRDFKNFFKQFFNKIKLQNTKFNIKLFLRNSPVFCEICLTYLFIFLKVFLILPLFTQLRSRIVVICLVNLFGRCVCLFIRSFVPSLIQPRVSKRYWNFENHWQWLTGSRSNLADVAAALTDNGRNLKLQNRD